MSRLPLRPDCTGAVSRWHDIQNRFPGSIDRRGFRSSETDRTATDDMADRGFPAETPLRDNAYRGSSRCPPHWHGFFYACGILRPGGGPDRADCTRLKRTAIVRSWRRNRRVKTHGANFRDLDRSEREEGGLVGSLKGSWSGRNEGNCCLSSPFPSTGQAV